jgi:Rha family phage regulatory protein
LEDAQILKPRITLIDGRVMATSLVVAEHFGKQHRNVMQAIKTTLMDSPRQFNELNFQLVTYRDAKGESGPMYRMTRDGFALIAMGFTGKAAIEWKVAYIDTFNAMEAALVRKLERPAATSAATAPAVNPVMMGLPPFTPRPFLELLHALDMDARAAYLICYLLATGAHRQALHASYRKIAPICPDALRLADCHGPSGAFWHGI